MLVVLLPSFKRFLKTLIFPSLLVLIQSCSQTPIGQELSDSFDSPIEPKVEKDSQLEKEKNLSKIKVPLKENSESLSAQQMNKRLDKRITSTKSPSKINAVDPNPSFSPQPYRITIKLSAANPSAPAESVTKALRLAGVKFEVEMIQLILDESSNQKMGVMRSKR